MMNRLSMKVRRLAGALLRQRVTQALGISLVGALLLLSPSEARRAGEAAGERRWETHTHTVVLKDRSVTFTFEVPAGWSVIQEGPYVSVQNVAPFNDLMELPGGLPEGFVKISYMLDPKAPPSLLVEGRGESIDLGGVTWQQRVESGGMAGDRTETMETVVDGMVFRVFAYVARTQGRADVLSTHLATLDRSMRSLRIEPVVRFQDVPGAPPYPQGGKPQATPIGEPIVP